MSLSPDHKRFLRWMGQTPPPRGIDGFCWIWIGSRNASGVPVWWQDGRTRFPHVWAWERIYGPKPAGRQLTPRCGRPACVRPDHRELRPRGAHHREKAMR